MRGTQARNLGRRTCMCPLWCRTETMSTMMSKPNLPGALDSEDDAPADPRTTLSQLWPRGRQGFSLHRKRLAPAFGYQDYCSQGPRPETGLLDSLFWHLLVLYSPKLGCLVQLQFFLPGCLYLGPRLLIMLTIRCCCCLLLLLLLFFVAPHPTKRSSFQRSPHHTQGRYQKPCPRCDAASLASGI